MRGVILAGGNGTRLQPLTSVTNKNLLPIYNRPMIFYPIETMVEAGVTEVLVVTGGAGAGDMMRVLGDGSRLGLKRLYFTFQQTAGGISQGLALAEEFAGGEKLCVILGDNLIFGASLASAVRAFEKQPRGAGVFLREVHDPHRFGIAEIAGKRIVRIEEKPLHPRSNLAVTGIYMYDHTVFDKIRTLKPSARGELEVTDLNNAYIAEGTLGYSLLGGEWIDAGTHESLHQASSVARQYAGCVTSISAAA